MVGDTPQTVDKTPTASLEKLAETSPVAITKVDRNGRIVYANSEAEELLDLAKADMNGRIYDDVDWKITYYDGSDYPSEELPFEIVKETGEPVENIRRAIEWPNGERKLLSINASPLFDDDGDFDGMVSIIEDVTEQVEADQREDHLRSVINSIRDVNQLLVRKDDRESLIEGICNILIETRDYHNVWIALIDENNKLLDAAEEGLGEDFERMLDRLKQGNLPHMTEEVLDKEGVVVTEDPVSSCRDCPLSSNYEERGSLSARLECRGEVFGLISASTPVDYAKDEEEQELFEEVSGDIGFALHSIKVWEEKESALKELRDKDERLERALEGGDLGTWDWNIETNEVQFNERWAEMKGYELEEIEPHLNTWKEMVHPDDLPDAREKLNEHLEGRTDYYEAEFRMQHKSGDWIWVKDKGKVIERDEDGSPVRASGTHLDITERKRKAQGLRRQKREKQTLADTVPAFIYTKNEDLIYQYANKSFCDMVGVDQGGNNG